MLHNQNMDLRIKRVELSIWKKNFKKIMQN